MAIDIVLFVFIAVCVYTDLRYRKVYNAVIMATVILGMGLNLSYGGPAGLWHSLLGLVAGFAFLFLFYVLGGIGAGDVKFMAAAGCLKGAVFVLMGGFYGALIGGVAAIVVMAYQKRLLKTIKKILTSILLLITFKVPEAMKPDIENASYLPYTVFLSMGLMLRWLEDKYFISGFFR